MLNPKIYKFKKYTNYKGKLVPISFDKDFPMKVKRIFFIYGKKKFIRGDHAHKKCSQFFIPVSGSFEITLNFKNKKKIYKLNVKKNIGLFVPPIIWCKVRFLAKKSAILVLASHKYEFNDYIETYKEFTKYDERLK